MNLKKIIREEVDDLQWMRDISPSEVFKISNDGMTMYINDNIVNILEKYALPTQSNYTNRKEILLGDFTWTSGGINYKFTAYIYPRVINDEKWWRVLGSSGDSGFGWGWITKRNLIGKRGRKQIFKQIIDRFDLNHMTL
jgi:hypothetical protein